MSDEMKTENGKPAAARRSHWYYFDGKPVLIQLREPWVGVTHPNDPVLQRDAKGEVAGVVSVPFLKGICRVFDDGDDIMFVLETTDPNPQIQAMAHIGIKKEDIAYITHIEKRLIQE